MGVITTERLRGFMSSPRWTAPQVEAAELICEAVESSLEDALFGAFISPRPWAESSSVLTNGGLVDTTYPVFRVTRIAGRAVAQDAPLPTGWRLQDQRLYRLPQSTPDATATMTSGWPYTLGYQPTQPMYSNHVDIEYEAGWGPRGALVLALLRKAQALMDNRHSDTVTVRGLTAQSPPKLSPEDWSVAELQPLGRYRRLGSGVSSSSPPVFGTAEIEVPPPPQPLPDMTDYVLMSSIGQVSGVAPLGADRLIPGEFLPVPAVSAITQVRVTGTAGVALSGHRVATRAADGTLGYASSTDSEHVHAPLWVTLGAVAAGATAEMLAYGPLTEPSWTWTPGGALFLGSDGLLTQEPPTAPGALFSAQVGVATTATSIFVDRQPSIILS